MDNEKVFMTAEGLKKTQERYDFLVKVKRPEVSQKIAEARSYGDLSENSEYDIDRNLADSKNLLLEITIKNFRFILQSGLNLWQFEKPALKEQKIL